MSAPLSPTLPGDLIQNAIVTKLKAAVFHRVEHRDNMRRTLNQSVKAKTILCHPISSVFEPSTRGHQPLCGMGLKRNSFTFDAILRFDDAASVEAFERGYAADPVLVTDPADNESYRMILSSVTYQEPPENNASSGTTVTMQFTTLDL